MKLIKFIILVLFFHSFAYADKNMKIGSKGKEGEVSRVVKVVMYDNYYEPSSIQVKKGETVKIIVKNLGELVHEYNIGTKKMHIDHQPEMARLIAVSYTHLTLPTKRIV